MPSIFRNLLVFCFLISSISVNYYGKRMAPKPVKSLIYNGIRYSVNHEKIGYVEAWDIKAKKKIWELKIYDIKYDPHLERDVQWVFITSLELNGNCLIVTNEKGNKYKVDIKNRVVIKRK